MDRRSFLAGILGLAVTPLIKPKSFFFFDRAPYKPSFTLSELNKLCGSVTYGAKRPNVIILSQTQWDWTLRNMGIDPIDRDYIGFRSDKFQGTEIMPVTVECQQVVNYTSYMIKYRKLQGKDCYDGTPGEKLPWGILRADKELGNPA